VNLVRKALTGAVALGLGVAGGAAQLEPALAAPVRAHAAHAAPRQILMRKPKLQLGAGIDLYTYPHQDFTTASAAEVTYLKALHANSVTVSFPFFMHGRRANGVYAKSSTPTPAELAILGRAAGKAGLYVSLRPLLSNSSLGQSRNTWRPRNLRAWFASYQKFLLPYAAMAQRVGIPRLYVGAEFQDFGSSSLWNNLDRAIRRKFKGALAYANNGHILIRGTGGKGVQLSADAYPDMPRMRPGSTVASLTKAWRAWDKVMPQGTVLSEVGIAGVSGAYARPWENNWPRPKIDQTVQTRWFEAACHAAAATHMGGIYFWAIGFGQDALTTPLSRKNQAAWEDGPTEKAVAACYKQLG
jgi:hypothetical protein